MQRSYVPNVFGMVFVSIFSGMTAYFDYVLWDMFFQFVGKTQFPTALFIACVVFAIGSLIGAGCFYACLDEALEIRQERQMSLIRDVMLS